MSISVRVFFQKLNYIEFSLKITLHIMFFDFDKSLSVFNSKILNFEYLDVFDGLAPKYDLAISLMRGKKVLSFKIKE